MSQGDYVRFVSTTNVTPYFILVDMVEFATIVQKTYSNRKLNVIYVEVMSNKYFKSTWIPRVGTWKYLPSVSLFLLIRSKTRILKNRWIRSRVKKTKVKKNLKMVKVDVVLILELVLKIIRLNKVKLIKKNRVIRKIMMFKV